MALQRFKELSLQKCNSGARARASSQNLPGALATVSLIQREGSDLGPKDGRVLGGQWDGHPSLYCLVTL